VIEDRPTAVRFHVTPNPEWPTKLTERVLSHFDVLHLGRLYSSQAARHVSGLRKVLSGVFEDGGAAAVRTSLGRLRESWSASAGMNSLESVFYGAVSENDWFCGGGFDF
jgi:hypothetical protein